MSFLLYVVFLKILIYFNFVSAGHKYYCMALQGCVCTAIQQFQPVFGWDRKHVIPLVFILGLSIHAPPSI